MTIYLTTEFLSDLKEGDDGKFVRHVLNHTIGDDGAFRPDRDDHRYEGIEGAWIRYVSRGTTAYRVIFVRRGADIYLYKAGRHKVENNVQPLRNTSGSAMVRQLENVTSVKPSPVEKIVFLKTSEATFISKYIKSMYHLRHHEVYLVAPFIDFSLLTRHHHFGRFLDKAVEEDTDVALVTVPPTTDEGLEVFKDLEERNIDVSFLPNLHTKLFIFNVDLSSRNEYQQERFGTAIMGSSNLTFAGIGFDDSKCNEELCGALPSDSVSELKDYVTRLTIAGEDYKKYAFRKGRQRK